MFYDTHAHLHFPDFTADIEEVIARASDAGVSRIITIGTDFETSRKSIELADRFPSVFAAVGWHPTHVMEAPEDIRSELLGMTRHPKVVALGETGLDYYWLPSKTKDASITDEEHKRRQASLFRQHLEVAAEAGLNCVVHQRESFDDCVAQLEPFADRVKGVFHCFSGSVPELQRVLALDSIVSFTGILTFKKAHRIRETFAAVPEGKFMFETDCPYLAPEPFRQKRCEPAFIRNTVEVAQQARGCSLEALSQSSCAAARAFFGRLS